jgi:AcrR family transcriptional regulator
VKLARSGGAVPALVASLLPERRERSGEATRKRILEAAEDEFAAKGFDGARLAAIARSADVQQSLIHHYFADKSGLYRAVVERALASITARGWRILDTMAPPRGRSRAKRFSGADLRALVEALVDMLVRFYSQNARVLRILRHEALAGGSLADELLRAHVKPQLDEIVARFETMRDRGEVRADVDARQLCLSAVAMACFPYMEEAFVATLWCAEPHAEEFAALRKREIVAMVMSRIEP